MESIFSRYARPVAIVAGGAFLVWIACLGWLATQRTAQPVLAPAQLLDASVVVVADWSADAVGQPQTDVRVQKVLWPQDEDLPIDTRITLTILQPPPGWAGSGSYLLPLVKQGASYAIAHARSSGGSKQGLAFRVYPWTTDVQIQWSRLAPDLLAARTSPTPARP
jgi:hypothetical protein